MHRGTHRLSSSVSLLRSGSFSEYHGFKSFADGASATPFSLSAGGCPATFFVERTGTIARVFCVAHLHVRRGRTDASKERKDLEHEDLPARDPQRG